MAEFIADADSVTDVDTDSGSEEPQPGPSKKAKMRGAAVYQTKYNPAWNKMYPFVHKVNGNPHKFLCACNL